MPKNNRTNENLPANHAVFLGGTGSGKTYQLMNHPAWKKCKRRLIWDVEGSYKATHRASTPEQLKAFYNKHLGFSGSFTLAFTPDVISEENFELFCQISLNWMHWKNPLLVVVEELADVARIGKASPFWGQLSRKARKYGAIIIAASQRPQEIDKTFIDQCAVIATGILKTERPRKVMAELLDVPMEVIKGMKPKDFAFRRDTDESILVRFGEKIPRNFPFMKTK